MGGASKRRWRPAVQMQAITDLVAYPPTVGAVGDVTAGAWTISVEQQALMFAIDIDDVRVGHYNGSVQVKPLCSSHRRQCRM